MTVSILRDRQIGDRACVRIELGQVAAACLSMEHLHDLHGRFLIRDVCISRTAVTDDCNIIIKVNGVHLSKLSRTRDSL